MRKWVVAGLAAVALVGGGVWYAERIAVEKVGNQIANLLQDPTVQQQVNRVAQDPQVASKWNQAAERLAGNGANGNGGGGNAGASQAQPPSSSGGSGNSSSSSSSGAGGGGGGGLVFHSRSEAIRFAMSRFSQAEIARYMSMYARGMTPEEKRAAKADV
ncbi:MAG: hypothetical protein IRY98_10510, partial [Alicyclobacillaceae bacterium]|nr:hypothetical protein [Alicyclobacillaceae bacterium]